MAVFIQVLSFFELVSDDMIFREKAVPLNRLDTLTSLAIGRIKDKTANVRKCAIQLLTTLLQVTLYC
jgi:hypothetical protein